MNCTSCGGGLEFAGGGAYARCTRCLALFQAQGGALTPMVVQAPGGGNDPQFNAIFAQQLGFGPPPQQGAGGYGAPQGQGGYGAPQGQGGYGAPQAQGGYGAPAPPAGGFGGPQQGPDFEVRINGMTPENYAKKKVSGMVWSLIIGGIFFGVIVLVFVGIGVFVYLQAPDGSGGSPKAATAGAWDGTSTFECGGNDAVKLSGVKASAGVKASGNCKLDLVGVSLDAPVGIEASANARVTMTGGSVTGSENSVVAGGNAQVTLTGAKVTGPVKKSGGAKVIGAK